jgi:hypothetical protein
MAEVRIEIEDRKLKELGIDQESSYAPLRFSESQFIGYWFDGDGGSIHFYVGSQDFLCKNTQKNIDLFEKILLRNNA